MCVSLRQHLLRAPQSEFPVCRTEDPVCRAPTGSGIYVQISTTGLCALKDQFQYILIYLVEIIIVNCLSRGRSQSVIEILYCYLLANHCLRLSKIS